MRNAFDKYFPVIFWIVLLALASWGAWYIVTSRENLPKGDNVQLSTNPGDIPPTVADEPIIEEVSPNGAVRWTLYLDKIIRTEGPVTELSKPRALYRFQSGEVLEVTGDSGSYDEDSGILILKGNVKGKARQADLQFSVGEMTWKSHENLLLASGNVIVIREGINLKGQNLKLDLNNELAKLELTGGVDITGAPEVLQNLDSGKLGN